MDIDGMGLIHLEISAFFGSVFECPASKNNSSLKINIFSVMQSFDDNEINSINIQFMYYVVGGEIIQQATYFFCKSKTLEDQYPGNSIFCMIVYYYLMGD